jgi:hypothetical protein
MKKRLLSRVYLLNPSTNCPSLYYYQSPSAHNWRCWQDWRKSVKNDEKQYTIWKTSLIILSPKVGKNILSPKSTARRRGLSVCVNDASSGLSPNAWAEGCDTSRPMKIAQRRVNAVWRQKARGRSRHLESSRNTRQTCSRSSYNLRYYCWINVIIVWQSVSDTV